MSFNQRNTPAVRLVIHTLDDRVLGVPNGSLRWSPSVREGRGRNDPTSSDWPYKGGKSAVIPSSIVRSVGGSWLESNDSLRDILDREKELQ